MHEQIVALIKERELGRAVIIDDAYDPPSVRDVADYGQALINSLRRDRDYEIVGELLQVEDLREDSLLQRLEQQQTIDVLFESKKQLPEGAWEALFDQFNTHRETQKDELQHVVKLLEDCGFTVNTLGTRQHGDLPQPDLVLIDLFFDDSATPQAAAIDAADKLRPYVNADDDPTAAVPLVVLISSREPCLQRVYEQFRNSARIPGCRFTFAEKRLFRDTGDEAIFRLYQLIQHSRSSLEFDRFIRQMARAAQKATAEFLAMLRRFELSDYADLTDLVISAEGIPLKQYLLELYALSWASIAESNTDLIEALDRLNALDLTVDNYPPNAFGPSESVLNLYERALYRPKTALDDLKEFRELRLGDILVGPPATEGRDPILYLVIVQDCDMLRDGVPDAVFLINGNVVDPAITRAGNKVYPFRFEDEALTVSWDVKKNWRALRCSEYETFMTEKTLTRTQRLRSPWSLTLQRQFIQELSRPAQIAKPYEIAAADIQILFKDISGNCRLLLDFTDAPQAFLLQGRRSGNDEITRLVISPQVAENIRTNLRGLLAQEGGLQRGSCDWLRDLLSNPAQLESLRTQLIVRKKNSKLPQAGFFECVGTALVESAYWQEGASAQQYTLMVNVRRLIAEENDAGIRN